MKAEIEILDGFRELYPEDRIDEKDLQIILQDKQLFWKPVESIFTGFKYGDCSYGNHIYLIIRKIQ